MQPGHITIVIQAFGLALVNAGFASSSLAGCGATSCWNGHSLS